MLAWSVRVLQAVLVLLLVACAASEERLAEHLRRGDEYYQNEQWNEARIEFWNALKIDPDRAEVHFKMAEALMHLQQYGDARWEYQEAIRLDPENVEWRMKLAEVYALFGAVDESLEQVGEVLDRDPEHVDALVLRAVGFAQKRRGEEALEELERALEIDPRHERALRLRARALEAKKMTAEAEATYRRLVEAHPNTMNHLQFALFWGSQGKPLRAVEEYQAAIETAESLEDRTRARRVLAAFHVTQKDLKSAEKTLLEARMEAPGDSSLALTLARFYAVQGNRERAEEMLESRVQQSPEQVEPLLTLADFYRRSGEPQRALETTERALSVDPGSEDARLQKAEYLIERSDDPQARQEGLALVEGVLAGNPNSVSGLLTLAKALLMERRYEDAAGKIQRVLDEQPSSQGHLLLGWAYIGMGQHELARSELLRAIQLDPDNHVARMELASLYLRTGQYGFAAEEARQVLEQLPESPRMLLVLADAELAQGHEKEAREVVERVVLEGPGDTRDHRLVLGRLYRRLKEPDRARTHLEAAAARHADDPEILRELVALDLQVGDPQHALERLDTVIEAKPDASAAYALRAAVYLRFRDEEGALRYAKEAEQDLKTAIEADPARLEAYGLLAGLYRATRRTEEAILTFEQAREARPDSTSVHLVLGTLYEQSGRAEDAIREYEEVVRRDPRQPIAKNNLAWLLAETSSDVPEDMDRALSLARDARELLPDNPNVADTLGWVMLKSDNARAAIPLFEEAIAGYEPGDVNRAVVRYHLAQAYARGGDVRRAIEEVERALGESEKFPDRSEAEVFLAKLRAS